ncbi:MAG: GHMP kinase [Candidatus Competibacteraceae bacterium]|nr:GHMP kinase [Candidatus Competibacteraceae bacterium]
MIITRTPFRISFVGGGSDLQAFYANHPGAVLSTTINQYMYISSHRFFEPDKVRVKYTQTETVDDIQMLQHPILKVILQKFNLNGIEISSIADVPAGTGMGSSSSFTVGVLHNLYEMLGQSVTKEQLATEACEIEIELLQEPIGKQDQYAAAYGGLNVFRFLPDGSVSTTPLSIQPETLDSLQKNLLLFYVGSQRKASDILVTQRANTSQNEKFNALVKMVKLVDDLQASLIQGRVDDMGHILHENWILKKQLADAISNHEINYWYETALQHGASGGKLLGAGGGGFLLIYCPLPFQNQVINALSPLRKFDFLFENQGSKLIYYPDKE